MIQKLARYIEKEMKRQNISSAQKLANRCNNKISPDFINKIKRNEPQTITLDTISIIAGGLNQSLTEILVNSGIIDNYSQYGLSIEEADTLLSSLEALFEKYGNIDINKLNNKEKVDLANQCVEYFKMISYMYK